MSFAEDIVRSDGILERLKGMFPGWRMKVKRNFKRGEFVVFNVEIPDITEEELKTVAQKLPAFTGHLVENYEDGKRTSMSVLFTTRKF